MAEIRVILGDDDRENEEFLGFDLDNIEETEERYIRQLDVLNDFDSDIEFSEMGSSNKEEIDSNDDILFSPTLLNVGTLLDPFKSLNLQDQRLLWRITNEKYIFLIFCSRKHCQLKLLLKQNEYARKHIEATPSKNWNPTNAEEIKAFPVYKLSWVFYNPLPKTCTGTKINCSIRQLLK